MNEDDSRFLFALKRDLGAGSMLGWRLTSFCEASLVYDNIF